MTLDALDQAFVTRWERRVAAGMSTTEQDADPVPDDCNPAAAEESKPTAAPEAGDRQVAVADSTPADPPRLADPGLVTRLLAAGRDQWDVLAAEVEAARHAGHRVIAVTGGERNEGRSTLVACLAAVLRGRGRDVVVLASTADLAAGDASPADGGRLHDRRIVLVDAGAWFGPGPIRRHKLLVSSLGCDAAILVRRADREPAASRGAALAAVGVAPLGEVVTFAAAPSPGAS